MSILNKGLLQGIKRGVVKVSDNIGNFEFAQDLSVPAGETVLTDTREVSRSINNIFFEQNGSNEFTVVAKFLNQNDTVVNEKIIIDEEGGQNINLFGISFDSLRVKFEITNHHTSDREIHTLTVSPSETQILDDIETLKKELIRPKHTVILFKDSITIDANSDESIDPNDSSYRVSTNRFYTADFSFIYAQVEVLDGDDTNEDYRVRLQWREGRDNIIDFMRSDFDGQSPTGDYFVKLEDIFTNERRFVSDWIEVKSRIVGMEISNNDDIQREFRVTLMGIR